MEEGIQPLARAAYHKFNPLCGDVAFALLRDLGADISGMTVGASLVHLGVGGESILAEDLTIEDVADDIKRRSASAVHAFDKTSF
jgi:hypothetical protein